MSTKRQLGASGGDASGSGSGSGRSKAPKREVTDRCSNEWWEKCNDLDFRKELRIHRRTFDFICEELSLVWTKKPTKKDPYTLRTRIAVCLWKLGTGGTNKQGSEKFDLPEYNIGSLFHEVCSVVKHLLIPKFIQWPNKETLDKIKIKFESISRIPNVVGSLQTTHIPILSPNKNNASAYRSEQYMLGKKAFYSIKLQGVVDHDGVFIDVDIGKPGKMSDDQILLESQLLRRDDRFTEGEWIVGNVSIPLMNRILVPYTQAPLNMTPTQITYNVAISKIREVGLEAIVKLKGRWVCLKQPLQFREDVANVVEACCVLHNMCRLKNDEINPEWVVDDYENDIVFPPIASSDPASQARDKIAEGLVAARAIL